MPFYAVDEGRGIIPLSRVIHLLQPCYNQWVILLSPVIHLLQPRYNQGGNPLVTGYSLATTTLQPRG